MSKTAKTTTKRVKQSLTVPNREILQLSEKKQKFIRAFVLSNGHITDSARAVPIHRQTYYDWLRDDSKFKLTVDSIEGELNDEARQILIDKWAGGDTQALTYWLSRRHPDFKPQSSNTYIQDNTKIDKIEFIIDED